ncbi:MAG TPA: hypothetical protein VJJ83_02005 [Candidatus Babeliales bacterium]|nr:hypothetical protein [Candidatus Babeliales bacterium]
MKTAIAFAAHDDNGNDYRRQQQDHREVRELERDLEQADLLD